MNIINMQIHNDRKIEKIYFYIRFILLSTVRYLLYALVSKYLKKRMRMKYLKEI